MNKLVEALERIAEETQSNVTCITGTSAIAVENVPSEAAIIAKQALAEYRAEPTEDEIREMAVAIEEEINLQALDSIDGKEPTQQFTVAIAKAAIEAFLKKRG